MEYPHSYSVGVPTWVLQGSIGATSKKQHCYFSVGTSAVTFDNSIEYNDFLNLKFNPINLDDVIYDAFNDHEHNFDSGLNSCTYVIDSEQVPVSHNDDFSILHLNPRSVHKNFDDIHAFISGLRHTFSLITLSETWFKVDGSNLTDIDDDTLLSAPRRGRRSGGSAVYIHNCVSYLTRDDLKLILDPHCNVDHSESIFIEITISNGKNTIVGNIYRAHGTDAFVTDLSHCLTKITAENKHRYVSGDFNLDLLKYDNNNLINNFVNMSYNHCMFPLIDRPTRITYNSATLLDNIFTNVIDHKIKSGIFVAGITDYFPIYQITSSISTSNCRAHPNYYKSRLINEKQFTIFIINYVPSIGILLLKLIAQTHHIIYF